MAAQLPMNTDLANRLSNDFTLFNLNDPVTTRFYVKHLDYFVFNFPYFKDLELLTEYFLAGNTKFTKKFLRRLKDFQLIINYSESRNEQPPIPSETTEDGQQPTKTNESIISSLYPGDESENDSSTPTDDMPACDSDAPPSSLDSSSLPVEDGPHQFPNHAPTGPHFTVNSEQLVFMCFSKVITAFSPSCSFTPAFIYSLALQINHTSISLLFAYLLQDGTLLQMFVRSRSIPLIIDKNIKALEMIIESVMAQNKSAIDDEEELLDQIEAETAGLLDRFIAVGEWHGYITPVSHGSPVEESLATLSLHQYPESLERHPDLKNITHLYQILLTMYSNRNTIKRDIHCVNTLNRYVLYYLRLQSYSAVIEDQQVAMQIIRLLFTHRQNAHLQVSAIRMILKMSVEFLDSLGFIDAMCDALYGYAAASRTASGQISIKVEEYHSKIWKDVFGTSEILYTMADSLWAFLVRLYMRYLPYIKDTKEYADHIGCVMVPWCRLEKARYQETDPDVLKESCGFERYVVECMLSSLPRSSIFEDEFFKVDE